MLYKLLEWLSTELGGPEGIAGFGVLKYLSFRSAMAIIFSLVLSLVVGKWLIKLLRRKLIGETIRDLGPEGHKKKAGTPTMGGLIIIFSILIPTLLWADLSNAYVQLILISTVWMGLIGFLDDYIKVFKKNKAGLQGKFKIVGQVGLGLIVGLTMIFHHEFKGPAGNVNHEATVMSVSPELEMLGFKEGDRILSIDGKAYATGADYFGAKPAATYQIERVDSVDPTTFKRTISTIAPKEADRLAVHDGLFGLRIKGFETTTNVPFLKNTLLDYSGMAFWEEGGGIVGKILYVLIVIFIVTAVSNGVNITDGLDGLAAGTSAVTAVTLFIFAYVSGNAIFAGYLNISYIPRSAELTIFCASMIGACVGFLWYNTHPAQVFMGDTGSLMLGGAIGVMALMIKKELLLPLFCGVFFVESLSVILQVSWFKYTKRKYGEGRRILRMAPVHHHFELGGLHEAKIVARFWVVAAMLNVLAFVTLKLR
jgi:phospho-N-acetylmuramoyl-pentapeptide-transferase